MLSFVFLAEDWYEIQKKDDYEYDRLLEIVKHDLESLEFNIYHTWMKVLKRRLHKMIVPAIIESQSLPGFITNDGNRFLNKFLQTSSTPQYSMDDLLSLLNKIYKALRGYFIEDSIITQAVTELLKLVGVTAFNDLLLRRNFLSWKRGLQINYNITRIEEWCKSHDMPEGTLQLEHLMVSIFSPLPAEILKFANSLLASYQAFATQEGHTQRYRDYPRYLLDALAKPDSEAPQPVLGSRLRAAHQRRDHEGSSFSGDREE